MTTVDGVMHFVFKDKISPHFFFSNVRLGPGELEVIKHNQITLGMNAAIATFPRQIHPEGECLNSDNSLPWKQENEWNSCYKLTFFLSPKDTRKRPIFLS